MNQLKIPVKTILQDLEADLCDWARDTVDGGRVSFDAPTDSDAETVHFHLWDFVRATGEFNGRQGTVQNSRARYLVIAAGGSTFSRRNRLAELFSASIEHSHFQIDPLPDAWWNALGVNHLPAFLLSAPFRLERVPVEPPLVRHTPEIRPVTFRTLNGRVVGPRHTPVAGAVVMLEHSDVRTVTDYRGEFELHGVPLRDRVVLVTEAKGVVSSKTIDLKADDSEDGYLIEMEFKDNPNRGE